MLIETSVLNNRQRSCAFTLVEMLVVIVIIGILAALLFPSLSGAKLKAQQTACLSNVKQLTVAYFTYVEDQQSLVTLGPTAPHRRADWMGALSAYYSQSDQLRLCPSAPERGRPVVKNPTGTGDSAWWWTLPETPISGSYGFNGWLYTDSKVKNSKLYPAYVYHNEASLVEVSQTPVFVDCVWINLWVLEKDETPVNLYNPTYYHQEGMARCCIARHGGRAASAAPQNFDYESSKAMPGAVNMGLADGHAELTKLDSLWNYRWHLNWQTPSPHP